MKIVKKSDIILNESDIKEKIILDESDIKEKNDLIKKYVDERMTIQKISKIYKCDRSVIRRKLKKYEISIRPRGSFIPLADDGKSLYFKYIEGEISSDEYLNKLYESKLYKNDKMKKELEYLYINEKKSITEISKIYKIGQNTVKNELKQYKIPIRPQGAFLVTDDGETLNSKKLKGEISSIEYNNEWIKNKGFVNDKEYRDELFKNKGYKDRSEYYRKMRYKSGKCLPMNENKDCSSYLGVYISEKILFELFENVKMMSYGYPEYDAICDKKFKIQVKSSCLHKYNNWYFHIYENKIVDYFFMIAFDNRNDLNIMYIWLIKGDAVIEKNNYYLSKEFILNEKQFINIINNKKSLKKLEKYEIKDKNKLEKARKIVNELKKKTTY